MRANRTMQRDDRNFDIAETRRTGWFVFRVPVCRHRANHGINARRQFVRRRRCLIQRVEWVFWISGG